MSSNHVLKQAKSKMARPLKWIKGKEVRNFFRVTWIIFSLVSIILAAAGVRNNLNNGSLKPSTNWDLINSVSFGFVLYTIVSVIITHKVDESRKGGGIVHAYKNLPKNPKKPTMVTNTGVISAIMARQAIHIAIALGLLVVVFQGKFLDPGEKVKGLSDSFKQFQTCIAWIVTGGFSLSVVLILVSALCYDYSCRFQWTDDLKLVLLRKGLKLDIWAWYAFTVSLILSIAVVSPLLCVLINAGYGFLLLYYYFFPYPLPTSDPIPRRDLEPVPESAK